MAAEHGSLARYHGNTTRPPCRCDVCRRGWAEYMKARRDKNVAERSKTRMSESAKAVSNVVAMPTTHQQPVAAPDDDFEQEILAHLDEQGIVNRALRARVRKQCQILRDTDMRGHWVAALKHLDEILVRIEGPAKKRKGNSGRLQIIQQMAAKNDRMNQMSRKTAQ
jgi:hypothetical protein